MRVAFITGITGQDGSYLTEFLLEKGYHVWGMIRRSSSINTKRIDHLYHKHINKDLYLRYGDLSDMNSIQNILQEIKTKYNNIQEDKNYLEQDKYCLEQLEVYNLGAMSHVAVSFETPSYTGTVDGLGTLYILEVLRNLNMNEKIRFYQASTSELYGKVQEIPQNENTPFYPRSPYAIAKLYGYWITKNYREAYGLFACNGILFNHESPRRGETFVTRKVTIGIGKILRGEKDKLVMGNIDAERDWGHAKDYVRAMWMILQSDKPDDYVVATEEKRSVRQFIELVCKCSGIEIEWKGEGLNEVGYNKKTGKGIIYISEKYYRPAEVDLLLGDASKIKREIGWKPEISFENLVEEMIMEDVFI